MGVPQATRIRMRMLMRIRTRIRSANASANANAGPTDTRHPLSIVPTTDGPLALEGAFLLRTSDGSAAFRREGHALPLRRLRPQAVLRRLAPPHRLSQRAAG